MVILLRFIKWATKKKSVFDCHWKYHFLFRACSSKSTTMFDIADECVRNANWWIRVEENPCGLKHASSLVDRPSSQWRFHFCRRLMEKGSSRPWQDTLQEATGEFRLDGSALREYFRPLEDWLRTENLRNGEVVGWSYGEFTLCILILELRHKYDWNEETFTHWDSRSCVSPQRQFHTKMPELNRVSRSFYRGIIWITINCSKFHHAPVFLLLNFPHHTFTSSQRLNIHLLIRSFTSLPGCRKQNFISNRSFDPWFMILSRVLSLGITVREMKNETVLSSGKAGTFLRALINQVSDRKSRKCKIFGLNSKITQFSCQNPIKKK